MEIGLKGYGENAATFAAEEGVQPNMPVKMSANGTVGACKAGEVPCGLVLSVRGGYGAVQLAGYVTLPYSGTAPAVGYAKISADGTGGVKLDEAGRTVLVTDVDTAAKTCGFLL